MRLQKISLAVMNKIVIMLSQVLVLLLLNSCSSLIGTIKSETILPHPSSKLSSGMPGVRSMAQMLFDLPYGPLPEEKLDLCQPQATQGQSTRPAVLLIHGGGWISGDRQQFDQICQQLAQRGFVAATIDYRLGTASNAITDWPAQLVDVQLAVRWLRRMASYFDIDPQRVCAWGKSAGGHLSVYLGVQKGIYPGDQASLYANESPAVSCVVDEFGPVDFTNTTYTALNSNLMILFAGVTYQENPALYHIFSPALAVNMVSAPMLIVQGTQDVLVPPSQSIELQQRLQQNHVPVQYISYRGGHDFYGLSSAQHDSILAQEINFLIAQENP